MKIIRIVLICIGILVAFVLGLIVRDIPKYSLEYKLKITEVLTPLITLGIGIFVPFIVKKLIDDKRSNKNNFIGEFDSYFKSITRVSDLILQYFTAESVTAKDKDVLLVLLEVSDEELSSMIKFLENQCGPSVSNKLSELSAKQIEYWKACTNSEMMNKDYIKISPSFYKNTQTKFTELKDKAREVKAIINSL